MPFYFDETQAGEQRKNFPSLTSEVLTEQFAQTFEENPIASISRANELHADYIYGKRLTAESARQQLKNNGLEAHLKIPEVGISDQALDTLMFRKKIKLKRQEVFANAQGGAAENLGRLGIALGTSLIDPINVATGVIPVVGEAKYLGWLGKAGGIAGRTAVRAGVGAAEGLVGAALVEPIIAGSLRYEQADYDMSDSLMNVAFGGVFGAGLHTTFGAVSDGITHYRESRSDIPRGTLTGMDKVYETRLANKIDGNINRVIDEYSTIEGSEGGKILNTDLARELSSDYRADRTRSAAVHEPASYLVKKIYERKLAEAPKDGELPLVVFSGGGTGAGKTTGLELAIKQVPDLAKAQIIYDTNLNGLQSSVKKIDQALEAGKDVKIIYTYREPTDALVNGALPRAVRMGRTVPIEEHAKTHVESLDTIRELQRKYAGDDHVDITILDNSHGKGGAKLSAVEDLPKLAYDQTLGDLHAALDTEFTAGRIPQGIYTATKGKGGILGAQPTDRARSAGRAEQGNLTAEERLAAASPIQRDTAIKQAVVDALVDSPEPVGTALADAEKILARETDTGTPTADRLAMAKEEQSLAETDLDALVKRLGVEKEDAEYTAVAEAAANSERWAKAAELATVCLTRGG